MKTQQEIEAAFWALGYGVIAVTEPRDADQPDAPAEAVQFYNQAAALLAWVLDVRTYPEYARMNAIIGRLLHLHDQIKTELKLEGR